MDTSTLAHTHTPASTVLPAMVLLGRKPMPSEVTIYFILNELQKVMFEV